MAAALLLPLLPLLLLYLLVCPSRAADADLHCSQTVLGSGGQVLVEATLAACVAEMSAPSMPVSYNTLFSGNLTVTNQLSLNNIVNVNEVDSLVEIDFYYRQSWVDPRWVMTDEFWAGVDPLLPRNGLEIYYLYNGEHREDPLPVWVPDATFQDSVDLTVLASTIKLYPDGTLFFSRHCLVAFKQAHLDLSLYPLDFQTIEIKLLSYGLTAQHMKMVYDDPPIEYLLDSDGDINFGNNAIWEHKEGDFNATIKVDDLVINGYVKTYETLRMKIYIERQGTGVLMRFAMPILILLILAGLTFWANFETRIDTTMTILLSVSALYVVILGSIPQVGYLTDFDVWIFNMFVMLAACVFAHQLVVNSFRKVDQWPFRAVVIRLIEMSGRVIIIPLSMFMFGQTFEGDEFKFLGSYYLRIPVIVLFLLILVREGFGVRKSLRNGLFAIYDKIAERKRKISWWEKFIVNLFMFRVLDITTEPIDAKLKRKKRMDADGTELMNSNVELSTASILNGSSRRRSKKNLSRFRSKSLYDSDDEM